MVMGPGENGPHVVLRWLTDITASGYGYYCVGLQILLRRDTDITASRGTDITASASADVSVGLLRRLNQLTETAEFADRTT